MRPPGTIFRGYFPLVCGENETTEISRELMRHDIVVSGFIGNQSAYSNRIVAVTRQVKRELSCRASFLIMAQAHATRREETKSNGEGWRRL